MKTKPIFRGVGTALVTPFKNGRIDIDAFALLTEEQIRAGADALIVGGTTGECQALTEGERRELYRLAAELCHGKVPLILGTGSNDTVRATELTELAAELGADGALAVTPYYNKGTEEGIYRHYRELASVGIPMILYNVPSRTGVNMPLRLIARLSELENIVALKEASEGAVRLMELSCLSDAIDIYSGADELTYLNLALGGAGVISVASNVVPGLMLKITESFLEGRYREALLCQRRLMPLISALFSETNPAPVKYALSRLSLCSEEMRLPLYPVGEDSRAKVELALSEIGLL